MKNSRVKSADIVNSVEITKKEKFGSFELMEIIKISKIWESFEALKISVILEITEISQISKIRSTALSCDFDMGKFIFLLSSIFGT